VQLRGSFRKLGATHPCKDPCLHLHVVGTCLWPRGAPICLCAGPACVGRAIVPPTRALCGALGSRSVPPLGGTLGVSQPPAPLRAGPPSADDDHSGARQCWHSHAITHYPRTDTPADFKRARRSKHVHTRTRVLTKNERMQSARQGAGGCTCMLKPRAVCVCVCVYVCTRRVRQERGSRGSTLSPASRRSPLCLPHTHTHADIHTCVCVCVCVCVCIRNPWHTPDI